MRETLLYHLLRQGVVLGRKAFHQCHRAAKRRDVALEYAFHKLRCRGHRFAARTLGEIGVDYRWLWHTAIDGEAYVLGVVFGMFHHITINNLRNPKLVIKVVLRKFFYIQQRPRRG